MRKIIFILSLILIFTACTENKKNNISEKKIKTETSEKTSKKEVKLKPEILYFFENEFRDLKNFEFKTDFPEFDKIYYQIKTDKNSILRENLEAECEGDACSTWRIIKKENELIKILKTDCGEYGFMNDELYYKDSTLKLYREFELSILEFPNENTETLWALEETQYIFDNDKVCIRKRKRHTRKLGENYRLNNEKYEISYVSKSDITKKLEDIKEISDNLK